LIRCESKDIDGERYLKLSRKLGDVHKIIRIPEETGVIHKKVGPIKERVKMSR
jgi:hypothetical protein